MTKKEVIQHQFLLEKLGELEIDNKRLRDSLELTVSMHTESLNNNKILIDLIKQKLPLVEKSQKREDLYFQYLKNIKSNFIYKLFFSKKHLELFKQLENINTDGN